MVFKEEKQHHTIELLPKSCARLMRAVCK
jgi:hypothetical protein